MNISDTKEQIKKLEEQINKMKNCMNCKNMKDTGMNYYCVQGSKMYCNNCIKWELQSDR